MTEHPRSIRVEEDGIRITRSDRSLHLNYAVDNFSNPHTRPTLLLSLARAIPGPLLLHQSQLECEKGEQIFANFQRFGRKRSKSYTTPRHICSRGAISAAPGIVPLGFYAEMRTSTRRLDGNLGRCSIRPQISAATPKSSGPAPRATHGA